jgi:hypothetical protein
MKHSGIAVRFILLLGRILWRPAVEVLYDQIIFLEELCRKATPSGKWDTAIDSKDLLIARGLLSVLTLTDLFFG